MPTRTGVLIPIVAAAVIIGVAGMLTLPTDLKLESVEFPRGTIMIDDKILEVQIADTDSLRVGDYHGKMNFRIMRGCCLFLMDPEHVPCGCWVCNLI